MDVSDGLAGDLRKLCAASGVAAEIEVARVPLSDAAAGRSPAEPGLIETALTGGDDYEVGRHGAGGAPGCLDGGGERSRGRAHRDRRSIRAGQPGVHFLDPAGKPLLFKQPSFSHF